MIIQCVECVHAMIIAWTCVNGFCSSTRWCYRWSNQTELATSSKKEIQYRLLHPSYARSPNQLKCAKPSSMLETRIDASIISDDDDEQQITSNGRWLLFFRILIRKQQSLHISWTVIVFTVVVVVVVVVAATTLIHFSTQRWKKCYGNV